MAKNKKNAKQETKSSKFVFWVIGLIAVSMVALIFLNNNSKTNDGGSKENIDYANQPFLGEETAPVSIIEFGDYKCPNCKNFANDVVPMMIDEFVNTGKAKFYYFHYPFINVDSNRTARFSEAVYHELGNEAFWEFHDLVFENQPEDPGYETVDVFTEEVLTEILAEIATDEEVTKVVSYFKSNDSEKAWKKDEGYADRLNVTGTPTIIVNGKVFAGQTMDDLKKMVNEAAEEREDE